MVVRGGGEGGAGLVGQGDRYPALVEGRPGDAGGGGEQEAAADVAGVLHQQLGLGIGGEADAVDVDGPAVASDGTVAVQ